MSAGETRASARLRAISLGRVRSIALGILGVAGALTVVVSVASARDYSETREPCARYEETRQPFFGDTHVHTVYSFDANGQDTRNTPRDAYRFARGERLGLQPYDANGKPQRSARLRRPLDFTALSDHSELLGEIRICSNPGLPGSDSDLCWTYRNFRPMTFVLLATRNLVMRDRFDFCGADGELCLDQAKVVWQDIQAAAEEAYDRTQACAFTSFVGYEWTGTVGGGMNIHRNVIFRNEKVPELPPSWVDTPSAFDLWSQLQRRCIDGLEGCDALTIPHNSNLSGPGLMFESARLTGPQDASLPVDLEEARLRQRWEPLIEIMQHKGDSECLPGRDTKDEACGFEKLPYNDFTGVGRVDVGNVSMLTEDQDLSPVSKGMVRDALKKGVLLEKQLGANPLKYGIIAATDTHLGTPGLVAEDESKGHGGAGDRNTYGLPDNIEFNPGGLAVLWAEENSRDSLFDAMQRREAYGTSGTRPIVRFFGGWDYKKTMCQGDDFAEVGYAGGVPMGGDLPSRGGDVKGPTFAVQALQDPGTDEYPGTPLQRVQIVKGWVEGGKTHEKVIDVAGRKNRASVDLETCEPKGNGATKLCTVWQDRDFRSDQNAFYYARVLENPTCRWSQHLCVEAGIRCDDASTMQPGYEACCSEAHDPVIQERAWTSPIWYTPGGAD